MKPDYLKIKLKSKTHQRKLIENVLSEYKVNTVCEFAGCPNKLECYNNNELTFILMAPYCSRRCGFCKISTINNPDISIDPDEPEKILAVSKNLGLKYVVLTSTTRDDLVDGGAAHFYKTINMLKENNIIVEVLIPDFNLNENSFKRICNANPNVIGHNLEMTVNCYENYRSNSSFNTSLKVLEWFSNNKNNFLLKTSILVGLGESVSDIRNILKSVKHINIDILIIGQYLQATKMNPPVKKYYSIKEFDYLKILALESGIPQVESYPFARSSHNAFEVYKECRRLNTECGSKKSEQ